MRLLHTKYLYLKDFTGNIPAYAILSHTWVDGEEVLFQDIQSSAAKNRKGFAKVQGFCDVAIRHGYDWVWIDTCCIDKSSSAELSEAINSMFAWYESSTTCFVYLADVDGTNAFEVTSSTLNDSLIDITRMRRSHPGDKTLSGSRWFTRGWTLQELIAPRQVEFYNSKWLQIGTKRSLCKELAQITRVNEVVLNGASPKYYSVAERMSWASNRTTTRLEDMAYCLLGLFNVNMPLLYGEGERAFQRLQEEIMKVVDDYTIFTWTSPLTVAPPSFVTTGILAASPRDFEASEESMQLWSNPQPFMDIQDAPRLIYKDQIVASATLEPPVVTARGIRITVPIIKNSPSCIYAALYFINNDHTELVCLQMQPTVHAKAIYGRVIQNPIRRIPLLPKTQLEVDLMTFYAQTEHSGAQSWQPNWLNPKLNDLSRIGGNKIFITDGRSNALLYSKSFEWGSFGRWRSSDAIAIFELDVSGTKIFELDESGTEIFELDESGTRIFELDESGTRIFEFDESGTKIFVVFGIDFTGNGHFPWCRIAPITEAADNLLDWTLDQFYSHRSATGDSDRSLVDYDRRSLTSDVIGLEGTLDRTGLDPIWMEWIQRLRYLEWTGSIRLEAPGAPMV